jgi:hypothetical protein
MSITRPRPEITTPPARPRGRQNPDGIGSRPPSLGQQGPSGGRAGAARTAGAQAAAASDHRAEALSRPGHAKLAFSEQNGYNPSVNARATPAAGPVRK